jgi:hypothetical protein
MARGSDSSRDPRRQVSPHLRAAVLAQAARRRFLTGMEPVDPVGDLSRIPEDRQGMAVWEQAERNEGEVRDIMMPDLGRQPHTSRQSMPSIAAAEPNYGMTLREWRERQQGTPIPGNRPSSDDPFPFGVRGQSDTTISDQLAESERKGKSWAFPLGDDES